MKAKLLERPRGTRLECGDDRSMAWKARKKYLGGETFTPSEMTRIMSAIETRAPGRPRDVDRKGICARAHDMKVHEEMEIDQIAEALYRAYDRSPDEARRKARRAVSWGKRHCPDCV